MGRVAILGDVGGFVDQLVACLSRLGVTSSVWPDDLHVIQVGDLLGGNQDVACCDLVEPHLRTGRWTQLAGNWELEAVGGPAVTSRKRGAADPAAIARFGGWFDAGLVAFATTVTTRSGRTAVVTHAGVTQQWWLEYCDAETDPVLAAAMINEAPRNPLYLNGEMCGRPGSAPSPVWASTRELWSSWAPGGLPWSQVHGHTATVDTAGGWLDRFVPLDLTRFATKDRVTRHARFTPPRGDTAIVGIDCGLWLKSKPHSLIPLVVQT